MHMPNRGARRTVPTRVWGASTVFVLCSTLLLLVGQASPQVVDYDIVYVRAPRYGEAERARWPEVFNPAALDPGADLMLLHPDGSEEVLVAGGRGAVTDPFVSFDASGATTRTSPICSRTA